MSGVTMRERLRAAGFELLGEEPLKVTVFAKPYGYSGMEMAELTEDMDALQLASELLPLEPILKSRWKEFPSQSSSFVLSAGQMKMTSICPSSFNAVPVYSR